MMFRTTLLFLTLILAAAAAPPVATVSSSTPFQLRGATVPAGGVPSWPVLAGDTIATADGSAQITFRDGSRIVLEKSSRVVIERQNDGLRVRLSEGAATFNIKPK